MKYFTLALLLAFGCNQKNNTSSDEKETTPAATQEAPVDNSRFNGETDLLLAHYDCKTDVDDIHSAAALRTMMSHPDFQGTNFHVVAGTYGIQEGLYVPANELLELAFGDRWSDAHNDFDQALEEVYAKVNQTLGAGGEIWIAEGGQSDFSAALALKVESMMGSEQLDNIHVVQHSDWNEEVTTPEDLEFVKTRTQYHRIEDGNASDNGTPDFRDPATINWQQYISDPVKTEVWNMAISIANEYNAAEGRYDNEAVGAGGLDFSDTAEVCWIFGVEDIKDANEFFERYGD